jgi:hypothetical protein
LEWLEGQAGASRQQAPPARVTEQVFERIVRVSPAKATNDFRNRRRFISILYARYSRAITDVLYRRS